MGIAPKALVVTVLFGLCILALAGCGQAGGPLDGTSWRLVGWTLSSLHPLDFTITARFAEGRISGSAGVNSYGGPYKTGPGPLTGGSGAGDAFAAGPLAVTAMAGPEPAMRAEKAYLTLLGQARSFQVTGGRLTLYDQGGNESLLFEAVNK